MDILAVSLGVLGGSWLDSELAADLKVDAAEWVRPWEISGRVARADAAPDAGATTDDRRRARSSCGVLVAVTTGSQRKNKKDICLNISSVATVSQHLSLTSVPSHHLCKYYRRTWPARTCRAATTPLSPLRVCKADFARSSATTALSVLAIAKGLANAQYLVDLGQRGQVPQVSLEPLSSLR